MGASAAVSRAGAAERHLAAVLDQLDAALAGPLAALQAAAEAVGPSNDAVVRESLELIVEQARGLHGLTRAYFDHLALVLDPSRPSLRIVALRAWLADVHARHADEASARGVTCTCSGPAGAEEVRTDPDLCARIADALVSNALAFAPVGGCVEIAAHRDGTEWVLTVSDNGPGIPLAMVNEVMKPFVQLASPHPAEPTAYGLGLATCRVLVERLGGTLQLGPREGGGTLALVRFPGDGPD